MEQQNKTGTYIGVSVALSLMLIAAIWYMVGLWRTTRKSKGDEEKANHRHKHHRRDHHHRQPDRSGKKTASNAVELQTLRPVVPAGKDQGVRTALRGGSRRYSPSSLSKSTWRRSADRASASSSRSHKHHSYRTRPEKYPAVVPRTSGLTDRSRARRDPHAQRRRAPAPRRSDPLGWPLPRVVVTSESSSSRQHPRPVIRAEIRPAASSSSSSSHLRPPPAHHFARELRRTEKFSMTQSERGDRVRESDESGSESDGENRRSYVSGASSGICDYLKLLNSSPSPAPEEQPRRNSRPQLPALGISHKLSFEVDDDKYGI